MASHMSISVHDRHAFRPDLRDAVLEDRTLLSAPPSAFLLSPQSNGFNFYLSAPGFTFYFGNGGGGGGPGSGGSSSPNQNLFNGLSATGPIGASFGLANELGQGLTLNAVMRISTVFSSSGFNASTGSTVSSTTSPGSLLSLPSSFSGDSSSIHNTGPIGTNNAFAGGQSATFSSGGNFASTFSNTYNGFSNTVQIAPATTPQAGTGAAGSTPPAQAQDDSSSADYNGNPTTSSYGSTGRTMMLGGRKMDNLPHPTDAFPMPPRRSSPGTP
jgi:hypothetical protein